MQIEQEGINKETQKSEEIEREVNLNACLDLAAKKESGSIDILIEEERNTCTKGSSSYFVTECGKIIDKLMEQVREDRAREEQNCFLRFGK